MRQNNAEKKRPVIGFMIGNYHSDHPVRLVAELYERLSGMDVDIRFYTGTECRSFLEGFYLRENSFDYQFSSLYGYSRFDDLDVLIVGIGTIMIFQEFIDVDAFIASLPDTKLVLLETEAGGDDAFHILLDNKQGIVDCVEHLIRDKGCKDLAFMCGPMHNPEAMQRLEAFKETTKKYGIIVEEDRYGYGDFSENVAEAVEKLLDAREQYPQAIVSANDEMALTIYKILKQRGLKIGEDIYVTGFDDIELARFMEPPLTTVLQDYGALANVLADVVKRALAGEQGETIHVPTRLILRDSTGDIMDAADAAEVVTRAKERVSSLHGTFLRSNIGPMMLRELLLGSANEQEFFTELGRELLDLGIRSVTITGLEESVSVHPGEVSDPKELRLWLRECLADEEQIRVYGMQESPRIHEKELTRYLSYPDHACATVSFLLYYEECQYGIMTAEVEPQDIAFVSTLAVEIGTALRFLHMSIAQRQYEVDLIEKNKKLDEEATHDALTGLYNRAGGFNLAEKTLRENPGKRFTVVAADLDHLKQINDLFGHGEGDAALRAAAAILEKVLRKDDIIARIGGDEYFVLFASNDKFGGEAFAARIIEACKVYNADSDKPYFVELSAGYMDFVASEDISLTDAYHKADYALYLSKQNRRSSVVREDYSDEFGEEPAPAKESAGETQDQAAENADAAGRAAGGRKSLRGAGKVGTRAQKARKNKRLHSLRWHILRLMSFGWLAPFLGAFVLIIVIFVQVSGSQLENTVMASAERAVENYRMRLEDCESASRNATYLSTIKDAYSKYERDGNWPTLYKSAQTFVSDQYEYNSNLMASFIVFLDDPEHICYCVNQQNGGSIANFNFFKQNARDAVLKESIDLDTATTLVAVEDKLYIVRNLVTKKYKPYAVIALELNAGHIFASLANIWGQFGCQVDLEDGAVIFSDFPKDRGPDEATLGRLGEAAASEWRLAKEGRYKYAIQKFSFGSRSIITVVAIDQRMINEEIRPLLILIGVFLLLTIVMVFGAIRFFENKIIRSLKELMGAYEKIREGRFGTRVEADSDTTEIYYLQDSFNKMSGKLHEQFEKIYVEEINLKEAQLSALRSQINPTLLTDTLEIIEREAAQAGSGQIASLSGSLREMAQASLERADNGLVSLGDELRYADAYLNIVNMRLGGIVYLERRIDEKLLLTHVPKCILQPVLENIVESVRKDAQEIVISMRAREEEPETMPSKDGVHLRSMLLEIGTRCRLSNEDLDTLSELFDENYTPRGVEQAARSLRSAYERIRILCGEGYGIHMHMERDGEVVFQVRVRC